MIYSRFQKEFNIFDLTRKILSTWQENNKVSHISKPLRIFEKFIYAIFFGRREGGWSGGRGLELQ